MRGHRERHRTQRTGWLRAAVLGANDGIVSTASLVLGVVAAGADTRSTLIAGVAGLMAGAMSMAAGEYVSVSSQADTERADLERERKELAASPEAEHAELTAIYVQRGLDPALVFPLRHQAGARSTTEAQLVSQATRLAVFGPYQVEPATVCDLCSGLDGPSCVYACPHDAAIRVKPAEFLAPADLQIL